MGQEGMRPVQRPEQRSGKAWAAPQVEWAGAGGEDQLENQGPFSLSLNNMLGRE